VEAIATENDVRIPDDLLAELRSKSAAEGKTPDDLARLVVERFLLHRRLEEMVSNGRQQAAALGLNPNDVPRLIERAHALTNCSTL
jgi:hypothetical protein